MKNYFKTNSRCKKNMLSTIDEETEYYKGRISSDIVLTRYLYIKDEAKYALLVSILEKKQTQSLFFAYELYHSGFKDELLEWLWEIYYDFFAIINPTLESYILRLCLPKKSDCSNSSEKQPKKYKQENPIKMEELVYSFVKNLLIRRFSTDIFFLRKYIEENDLRATPLPTMKCVEGKYDLDCVSLAKYIYSLKSPISNATMTIILYNYIKNDPAAFESFRVVLGTISANNRRSLLLSRIIRLYGLYNNNSIITKIDRLVIPPQSYLEENEQIIYVNSLRADSVLKEVSEYSIPNILSGWTRFFRLERTKMDDSELKQIYYRDWIYYAARSPIWRERIEEGNLYNVLIDEQNAFDLDELEEEAFQSFHNKYGLEPDEQPLYVTEARIGNIIDSEENMTKWNSCCLNNVIII